MDRTAVEHAQAYLTINSWNGPYHIVDVRVLLERHHVDSVISLLIELISDHKKRLRKLILANKCDPRIDTQVAKCFRLSMALNTLRNSTTKMAA